MTSSPGAALLGAMAGKCRALWLVGDCPYKVHIIRHPLDLPDANQALTDGSQTS